MPSMRAAVSAATSFAMAISRVAPRTMIFASIGIVERRDFGAGLHPGVDAHAVGADPVEVA